MSRLLNATLHTQRKMALLFPLIKGGAARLRAGDVKIPRLGATPFSAWGGSVLRRKKGRIKRCEKLLLQKVKKLPDASGVYLFRRGKRILYIGKATSLRSRVKSYFAKDLGETRGPLLVEMIRKADGVSFQKTDSVLEALLLEAELIKKHQPPYNTEQKDDKSFNCVVITDEAFPRVLIMRQKEIDSGVIHDSRFMIQDLYGPFTNAGQLKTALKIIRKIFPFRDTCVPYSDVLKNIRIRKPCFNRQIGLCPGVCAGEITEKEYQKTIRHIRFFFEGKKKKLLAVLLREMNAAARAEQFEKAGEIKRTIFALRHIQDVALLGSNAADERGLYADLRGRFRIEAYDLSHFGGKEIVGAMAVVESGMARPPEYRLFKLRSITQAHEPKGFQEILRRRFSHTEWQFPQLVVVDGNEVELRAAEEVLLSIHLSIPIVAVVKNEKHRPEKILGDQDVVQKHKQAILLANSEVHRFAIAFQRKRRRIARRN